jgi:hypothetical protein
MDLAVLSFTLADPDYYEPLHRYQDRSRPFRPAGMPAGWRESRQQVWTVWAPPEPDLPEQGWKIHVSAVLDRAPRVLDRVAAVAVAEEVSFKHLATDFTFRYTHHKHGERGQAGKFCALYPPDLPAARRLLDRLAAELRDEPGPYILTDRRYQDSAPVYYRYGGFRPIWRVLPDGTRQPLLRDGSGTLVVDRRGVRFGLPDGVTDPFREPAPEPEPGPGGKPAGKPAEDAGDAGDGVRIGDYRVVGAVAHSAAGGAYRAVDGSGRTVFLKEARAHTGLYWDRSTAQQRLRREHRVLQDLHRRAPGLAPEPIDYFRHWEHEFLVTEWVAGRSLFRHVARQNPYLQEGAAADFAGYFRTCRDLLRQLAAALDRLHRLGYRFGDVNPRNLLVTDGGGLRLIDFEACGRLDRPPIRIGAPGFVPERARDWEGTGADDYGLGAMALTMLLPIHHQLARHPPAQAHLYADARKRGPVPADHWRLATRNYPARPAAAAEAEASLPDPDQLAADPVGQLHRLRAALGRELAATAAPDHPDRVWPTIPAGYTTNPWCVAYGAAGVLHALHHAGLPVDPAVTARLRREVLALGDRLPPGLHFGTAGIGWVLAEQGQPEVAVDLLAAAGAHPVTAGSGSWAAGTAGIGTAHLALHRWTGDRRQLDRAARIGDALCTTADLTPLLGRRNPIGLLHGRAGVALFLHQLWQATGEPRYLRHGTGLLHAELDRASEMPGGTLGFRDDDVLARVMVYLGTGAAGVGLVLTRYLPATGDERLAAALPRVFGYADQQLTVEPGLYLGLAGLGFAHAEHADLAGAGQPVRRERALRAAAGLFKYAVPGPAGRVRFLGTAGLRFSCELFSGTAGILLALDRILHGSRGQFFTLPDPAAATSRSRPAPDPASTAALTNG